MKDIDWFAVDLVSRERIRMNNLTANEKRMVIRRMSERMLNTGETQFGYNGRGKITAEQVAELLMTTDRSVQRYRDELPPATKRRCDYCGEPMWVLSNGFVEPHGTLDYKQCFRVGLREAGHNLVQIVSDKYRLLTDKPAEHNKKCEWKQSCCSPWSGSARCLAAVRTDLYKWIEQPA